MTWAKEDTEALRSLDAPGLAEDPSAVAYLRRAAAHIKALEARVAELEQSDLEAFVVEHLPYQLDDGTGDDANAEECVEYAADELRKRRKRIAALEAANRELRVLCEDSRRHADEEIAGLRGRIDTLEAERGTLVARVAGLEAKLADYKAGAEAEARAGDDARARARALEAERAAIVALLDRGIEKHKARDTQVADYLRNLRHRVLSGEHEKGEDK